MAICGPAVLPHSFFLGGPFQWTDLDRDKQREWQSLQAQKCPSCGTRKDEWHPDKGGDLKAYTAEIDECPGCVHVQRVQERVQTEPNLKGRRGLRVVLRPRR